MRSLLLVALALVVGVTSAFGQVKTFYVNQETGSNSYTGRQATVSGNNGPWATIAHANLQTIAGGVAATESGASDSTVVIYIMPGASATVTYDSLPQPRSAAAAGTRFNYYGYGTFPVSGVTTTIKLRIPGGTLVRDDVTYRNLYFNDNALAINGGDRDSILQCAMNGLSLDACRFTVVDDFENYSTGTFAVNHNDVKADQVKYCTLNNGRIQNLAGVDIIKFRYTFGLTVSRCRIKQVTPSTIYGAQFIYCGFDSGMTWKYNRWEWVNNGLEGGTSSAPERSIFMRDSTRYFTWKSDTMLVTGATGGLMQMAAGGAHEKTCHHYTIDSLYAKIENGEGMTFPDVIDNVTLTNSVIVVQNSMAISASGTLIRGDNLFDHNTFVSWNWGEVCCDPQGLPFQKYGDQTATVNFLIASVQVAGTDSLQFTNNIVCNMSPKDTLQFYYGANGNTTYAFQNDIIGQSNKVIQDWNLYWNKVCADAHGDKAIGNGGNGEWSVTEYNASFPAREARGRFGSPVFRDNVSRDSTFANFTADIDVDSSLAIGRGKNGSDIGARSSTQPTFYSPLSYIQFDGDSGITYVDSLLIRNTGTATLVLSNLEVVETTGHGGCTAVLSSSTIAAGAEGYLVTTVVGPSSTGAQWRIYVATNDRKNPTKTWPVFWLGGASQSGPYDPPGGGGKQLMDP